MNAAGWSNAETFRKFYDKPLDTEAGSFGTELVHAIDAWCDILKVFLFVQY